MNDSTAEHPAEHTAEHASQPATTDPAQSAQDGTGQDLAGLRIAVIGAGNMGGPVVRAFLAAGADPAQVQIVNSTPDSSRRAADELGVTAGTSGVETVTTADVVILGVKPYQILDLAAELRDTLPAGARVISLAAGITLAQLERTLPAGQPVLRAMPNTPIAVGEGAVGLMAGSAVEEAQLQEAHALFARAGVVVDITEEQVHAFIGAAGSLPGFAFAILEAMTDEAVRLGLKRDLADSLVQQTVRGAATMLLQSGVHPAVAKNGVSSPGGTTVEGLAALESHGVRSGIAAAMAAAAQRSRDLTAG
ncbi:MAG TPA: pyrroline-5-carboxylate reductase [Candidatus Brachybacterium merdigallinarum]|nr:pyrroline-5-carboxylate reductase [Candidatus Brachybacterium merdigallinarum]